MRSGKILFAVAALALWASAAEAASFKKLTDDGYRVAPMSRGKSGGWGWVLSKAGDKQVCRLDASMAIKSSSKLVSILSNGRMIDLDRKVFEAKAGDNDLPTLSDLKAGRPRAKDVGACSTLK